MVEKDLLRFNKANYAVKNNSYQDMQKAIILKILSIHNNIYWIILMLFDKNIH